MYRAIDYIFVQAWNIFLQAQDTNDHRLDLKKFAADLLLLQSTEETRLDLDDDPTLAQTSVHDLIHKQRMEQTKGLKAEISTIKTLVKDLQSSKGSKNQMRGPSGALKQKEKAQGHNQSRKPATQKADGAANDSQPANKKKSISIEEQVLEHQEKQVVDAIQKRIRLNFGFVGDPDLSRRHNVSIQIATMPTW
jgi:hypothetical protein